jgi:hypothetical protein
VLDSIKKLQMKVENIQHPSTQNIKLRANLAKSKTTSTTGTQPHQTLFIGTMHGEVYINHKNLLVQALEFYWFSS